MTYQGKVWNFEGKIQHRTAKSYIVEMTLGGRYFIPKKCITEMGQADPDGNIIFEVTDWWWNKKGDFEADEQR